MANTYLTRTASGTDGTYSQKRNTISMWLKRSSLSDACFIEGQGNDANATQAYFDSNTNLTVNHVSGNSSLNFQIVTNRKFRDTSAWYHFVITIDTTLGTAADRVKIYVNGVRETSFSSASYPGQNATTQLLARLNLNIIGRRKSGGVGLYFDGSMSHVHVTDGTAYQASSFGSVDSVTGEWQINTSPNVTYGNNGFFILKDGNTITDSSTNSNNFSLSGGTLTNTKDCPSNVFSTLNHVVRHTGTVANGNTRYGTSSSSWIGIPATLGNSTGKWYWEYKLTTGAEWSQCGIVSEKGYNGLLTTYVGAITNGVAMNTGGGDIYTAGGSSAWFGSARSVGQIISVALDCDNNKIYWGTNGVWGNSSNPATGSNGYSIPSALNTDKPYFPAFSVHNCTIDINFGNGLFGTTAITTNSGNGYSGAEGSSKFNYTVPTGYSALNTKGLNL